MMTIQTPPHPQDRQAGALVVVQSPDKDGTPQRWLGVFRGAAPGDRACVAIALGLSEPVECQIPASHVRDPLNNDEVIFLATLLAKRAEKNIMANVSKLCREFSDRLAQGACRV